MGDGRPDELRYTAFLSYSHKDAAPAGRLHRRLETYRVPRRLVGTETARGLVPARLAPIFRDREELPAATDLSQTVREALARSGSLIVLCSPAAAASLWVAEEIETFRRLHPRRPILAAILEGDPPDCFPEVLRAFGQDGTWHEPLATDLRRHRDGPRLGLLKLVAGITGIGLDALVQRDATRRIRRVMAVTGAALLALLATAALALVAINARGEAERQRIAAEEQIEFMLTDLRPRLRSVGRLDVMTAVNRQALSYYDGQQLEGLPAESLERRARVLLAMGEDDLNRDRFPAALAAFQAAHRVTQEQLARSPNDPERIYAHAQSQYWLGFVDYRRNNFPAARRAWQGYKALADRLLALDARNTRWLRESGYAEGNLCTIALAPPADRVEAGRACPAALGRMEEVRRLTGDDPAVILDLANRHGWVADAWNLAGNWDRVLHHRQVQERMARWLIARDPDNIDYQDFWMRTQLGFARLLEGHGERARARSWYSGAARTVAILRARDPENASWRGWQRQIARAMD
ncbi:MAG TPA: toll/interleukin-1 receptor domain-containing protein [Allosphingosinicella sp.]|nr:toll/interleukin-1 receptor domain-containing protein [Allosphingosinicella sp.]